MPKGEEKDVFIGLNAFQLVCPFHCFIGILFRFLLLVSGRSTTFASGGLFILYECGLLGALKVDE
jgi:hypothetical protein